MPPGLKAGDRVHRKGVSTPHLPAFTEGTAILAGVGVTAIGVCGPVHIRWLNLRVPETDHERLSCRRMSLPMRLAGSYLH